MALTQAQRNPVAVRAAIVALATAVVHVLAVMGLVDKDTEVAIGGVIDGLGAVVLVLWARAGVTPNAKVITRVTTKGAVVTGEAAIEGAGVDVPILGGRDVSPAVVDTVAVNPELVVDTH